jgi:putative DNA primase/helicase
LVLLSHLRRRRINEDTSHNSKPTRIRSGDSGRTGLHQNSDQQRKAVGALDSGGTMALIQDMLTAGLALVPIPHGEKGPRLPDWNTSQNCITDTSKSFLLEGGNIGLAHAFCKPTPTCAIDIDNYRLAKTWLAAHGVDLGLLLNSEDATIIWSGKKHSLKLLYCLPFGIPALESKKINGSDGKSILEFRCATKDGKTVQDVLPPSVHPDGHQYQWVGSTDPLPLPEIPAAVYALWKLLIVNGTRVAQRRDPQGFVKRSRDETPRQVATLRAALKHISADCSYEMWRNVVWALSSTGWKCAEEVAQEWSKTAPHRYKEDSFWQVANDYMPNHENPISVGTIYHHARAGGWNG